MPSVLKQGTRTCLLVRLLSKQVNCISSRGVKIASFLWLFPDNWYLPLITAKSFLHVQVSAFNL